jgi:hypothetical protein
MKTRKPQFPGAAANGLMSSGLNDICAPERSQLRYCGASVVHSVQPPAWAGYPPDHPIRLDIGSFPHFLAIFPAVLL